MRWNLAHQPYTSMIVHCKGVENANVDALSRSLTREEERGVRDQARCNRPKQPYICIPGNFGLNVVYNLDDAICQLDCPRTFL